jgi:hypothetical protein
MGRDDGGFAANGAEGPMHEYMVKAMADALHLNE